METSLPIRRRPQSPRLLRHPPRRLGMRTGEKNQNKTFKELFKMFKKCDELDLVSTRYKKVKKFKFMLHCICDDILGTLRDFWDGGTTESMSG